MGKAFRVGVAALQGAVSEHVEMLQTAAHRLGVQVEVVPVRDAATFETLDGLVLPGGESTTISKLLHRFGLIEPLERRVKEEDFPIMGTCAGMVLLAKQGDQQVERTQTRLLGLMDMAVDRNAFGRQRESFEGQVEVRLPGLDATVPAVFIRAPVATRTWGSAEPVANHEGRVVGVREGRRLALSFHPELTDDTRVHEAFLRMLMEAAPAEATAGAGNASEGPDTIAGGAGHTPEGAGPLQTIAPLGGSGVPPRT